jgi:hypothetical protein
MYVFKGGYQNDGWAAAYDWATSVGASVSVLWWNAASGCIDTLTVTDHGALGTSITRSWNKSMLGFAR